MKNKKESSKL